MSTQQGKFVWYELMTTDAPAATRFYQSVVGWKAEDSGMPGVQYTILNADSSRVGGLMELPQSARDGGAKPGWIGYVGVDDVDATAARVTGAGGAVHRPAQDIPGIGRFAIVTDPQGAQFTLFKPMGTDEAPADAQMAPGHVGWHELHARDQTAALAFYSDLFGWTKADAVDMGPMGTYQMFASGGATVGGMMTRTDGSPPHWLYYFNVADINAGASRVKDAGGQVINGPMEVPGGSWIVHGTDPQGATFAIVAPPAG